MNSKLLVFAAVAASFAMPAFAATTPKPSTVYYVAGTMKCSVTTKKPDGTKMIMIGTAGYPTKSDAVAAEKAAAECNPVAKPKP